MKENRLSELICEFASVLFIKEAPIQSLTHPITHSKHFGVSIRANGEVTMLMIIALL